MSVRSVITSLFPSSFDPGWSPPPAAAASLALALVVLTGLSGGGGSASDSAPDSELLSFSPFLFLFFFLLLCFLCFLFFLWGGSFPSLAFMSSFSGASSSPEGMSTAHSIVPVHLVLVLNVTGVLLPHSTQECVRWLQSPFLEKCQMAVVLKCVQPNNR